MRGEPRPRGVLRIGPAGWSYRDWEGKVYPPGKLDPLAYLSRFFHTVEINSSFYRPPQARHAERWVRRVEHDPDFRFTLKLWRVFTHEREEIGTDRLELFRQGVHPLAEAGRLGAVLLQFPWSFRNETASRQHLARLAGAFPDWPLVVEFRHRSWQRPEVLEFLQQLRMGLCNVDQPVIGASVRPRSDLVGRIGYFRCHGRNYATWFQKGAGRDARYDYLYTTSELEEQSQLVDELWRRAEETYVVYNNHFQGQAVLNALQLRGRLEGKTPPIPEPLARAYPREVARIQGRQ